MWCGVVCDVRQTDHLDAYKPKPEIKVCIQFRGMKCGVVVWCGGVVWCSVVWGVWCGVGCGVVWCGVWGGWVVWGVGCVVWCAVRCGVVRCGIVWRGV